MLLLSLTLLFAVAVRKGDIFPKEVCFCAREKTVKDIQISAGNLLHIVIILQLHYIHKKID